MSRQCRMCSETVVSSELWRRRVCDGGDRGFLEGMYLLSCVKYCSLIICDNSRSRNCKRASAPPLPFPPLPFTSPLAPTSFLSPLCAFSPSKIKSEQARIKPVLNTVFKGAAYSKNQHYLNGQKFLLHNLKRTEGNLVINFGCRQFSSKRTRRGYLVNKDNDMNKSEGVHVTRRKLPTIKPLSIAEDASLRQVATMDPPTNFRPKFGLDIVHTPLVWRGRKSPPGLNFCGSNEKSSVTINITM